MRSIRFSDKVLCDDDDDGEGVGVVGRMGGVASGTSATPRRNGFALREMGHQRRSSSSRLERGYHISSAASDTSSAAGFGVMSSMPRRSSNNNLERSGRASALARSYAVDNEYDLMPASMSFSGSGSALFPRTSQDYPDDLDYRGSVHGSSVTASSPYSPRSADSSSYHGSNRPSSAVPLEPILKNGTLPRSHSRASAGYGTLDNRPTYKNPTASYIPHSSSNQHDFNGRPSSRVNTYGNGSVVNGSSSSRLKPPLPNGNGLGTYRNGGGNDIPPTVGISALNGSGRNVNLHHNTSSPHSNNNNNHMNSNINNNNNHTNSTNSTNYPRSLPKTSPSMQIIATRHRPCCDCGCLGHLARQTSGANTPNGQQPICVLFSVFLIVSLLLVSGIMLYLRGDYVTNLLSSSPPSSTSSSSSSSSTTSSKHHTALSTKRCDEGLCAFGGVCVSTATGGSRCQCEDSCPFVYNPVCGSDGVTYDNECKLKLAACQKKRLIRQVADGACGGFDPCSSLTCPQYSICVPAYDGTSASCQCPQHCSEDVVNQVVCGTDGRDYASQCHLEKEACEKRRENLEVRFQGRCNPCQMLSCDSGTECHLVPDDPMDDHAREAKCMCSNNCPDDFVPICGSNGKTYINECVMKLDGCRRRLDLHLVYTGNCSSGLNQCKLLNCEFGQECEINKQGITNCICPQSCEKVVRPVCASNGQTYDNECEMKKYGCRKKMALTIQYIGICDSNGPCSKRTCNHHSICVESEDLAFCECPKCAEEYAPVCGSDGSTYHNVCKLQRAACQQETSIVVVEQGPCTGCANKTCDLYAVCHGDGFGNGLCQCPTSCEQIPNADDTEQVCGTDGQTYPSECHLKMEACQKQQFIVVANYGNCDLCRDVQCKHGAHCESGVCVCPTHCPNDVFEPLCGSDLVTYANECEMLKRTCQKDSQVTLLHHGTCTQNNELSEPIPPLPCYGLHPLKDATTGFDLDCGNVPYRVDCPSNSYCHLTSKFAKCCPKTRRIRLWQATLGRNRDTTYRAPSTPDCLFETFGCCEDGLTTALGSGNQGCLPRTPGAPCDCNALGTHQCNDLSGHCDCRPGVGGRKCDRCLPGFWGIKLILGGSNGCTPCSCSPFGSVRSDCEQTSGRCVCKPGILGPKCDTCPDGMKVSPIGCDGLYFPFGVETKKCGNETCNYGAQCSDGLTCTCDIECPPDTQLTPVCGNDGNTYRSECQLLQYSCRYKKHVLITSYTPCREGRPPYTFSQAFSTMSPSHANYVPFDQFSTDLSPKPTSDRYPDAPYSLYKSTRHISSSMSSFATRSLDLGGTANELQAFAPTPTSIHVYGLLGDVCLHRNDCTVSYSICWNRRCTCPPRKFVPSPDGRVCTFAPNNVDDLQNNHPVMFEESPCAHNPCFGGGTCEEHDGTFTCFCPSNRIGDRCERELSESDVQVPSFDGRLSYVELEPLENVEHKFSLEIEFKARAINGILIYAQEKPNGLGDFISVALIDGHVEFRYNLGSGVAVIRTMKKISLNHWHRVQAKRWHKDGMLKLDHHENVDGSSQGTQRSLDIAEASFVGGMPSLPSSQVLLNVDLSASNYAFEGCIRKFKLGYREVKVQSASEPSSVRRVGLRECSEGPQGGTDPMRAACSAHQCDNGGTCVPMDGQVQCLCPPNYYGEHCRDVIEDQLCASSPCLNGGTCSESPSRHDFYCMCPLDATGRFCELKTYQPPVLPSTTATSTTTTSPSLVSQPPSMNPIHGQGPVVVHNEVYSTTASASFFVPRFSGNSFLELPTLRHVGKSFQIEVWFLSLKPEGMLLYNGQNSNGHGDFLSLNLVDSHVQMRYDLGSGLANLTTLEQITLGEWHAVKITRNGPHGTIQLDQGSLVSGASFAPLTELNLELPLFLGGFRFSYSLSRESGIFSGLDGAIQRLIVNGNLMENLMDHVKDSQNIGHYVGPPCEQTPCQNGGVCRPFYRSYTCKCSGGFVGQNCEKGIGQFNKRSAVLFDGQTHLSFMNKVNKLGPDLELPDFEIEMYDKKPHAEDIFDSDLDHLFSLKEFMDYGEDDDLPAVHTSGRTSEKNNKFALTIRTSATNGLLIWTSQGAALRGDYLALAIANGFPELSFRLGKHEADAFTIRAKKRVDDGKWHKIRVFRKRRIGVLQIDDDKPVRGRAEKGASVLNTDGKVWIGGKLTIPFGLPIQYYQGFQGCIKKIKIFRKRLDLIRDGNNSNIQFCSTRHPKA